VRTGDGLLSVAGVTGIQQTARRYAYVGDTATILVRFTPQGAGCLGVPASELASRSVALDELLPPARAREAHERFLDAPGMVERVAVVEQLLRGLPFAPDPLVARALALIGPTAGEDASIAAVARSLGLSERQLERRFLLRVGITPKRFATLRRFERAVALAKTAPSLTSAALAAGYYDQSHFIRDFRRFTGTTPSDLLRGQR
jgi:transcriptional regulator GlxA family with amidase domain